MELMAQVKAGLLSDKEPFVVVDDSIVHIEQHRRWCLRAGYLALKIMRLAEQSGVDQLPTRSWAIRRMPIQSTLLTAISDPFLPVS
ncbi:MAG: hypothetical protein WAO01_11690 [Bradyrhizobium sp.]